MVIRESIEILREDTSIQNFKKEIKLLKSAGYKVFEISNDYVKFHQRTVVVDFDLLQNKTRKQQLSCLRVILMYLISSISHRTSSNNHPIIFLF